MFEKNIEHPCFEIERRARPTTIGHNGVVRRQVSYEGKTPGFFSETFTLYVCPS